jgi:hypothetical protein
MFTHCSALKTTNLNCSHSDKPTPQVKGEMQRFCVIDFIALLDKDK